MRIALAQTSILWENKSQNISAARNVIEKWSGSTDFILFPEMSFTGFSMNTDVTGENDGYTVRYISETAKLNAVGIGFGWVEKAGAKSKNRYSIVDRTGNEVSSYVKIHPFSYSGEDEKFVGGDEISLFAIDEVPFSTFICYDLRFPEVFRAVADKAHAVIVPACWPAKRSEHWKTLLRARAIENQVYVFAVNCVGDIGGQHYSGDSCVINPNGDVLEMLSDREGVLTYDFKDDALEYRKQFSALNDRRNDFYQELLSQ